MTDDALIEAMANAFEATGYEVSTIESMRAALAVARPIIEAQAAKKLKDLNEELTVVYLYGFEKGKNIERERCARIAESYVSYPDGLAAAIRETGDE